MVHISYFAKYFSFFPEVAANSAGRPCSSFMPVRSILFRLYLSFKYIAFFVHHEKQRPIQGFFPGTSSYITHFTGRHYFFPFIIPERIMCFSRLKRIRYADIISFIPHINIKRHIFLFFCFK
jgi:hypothetical protein